MKFKTGEPVHDDAETVDAGSVKWIAVRNRAFTSPSVYFGPFDSLNELMEWAAAAGISVAVVQLTDPTTDASTWW